MKEQSFKQNKTEIDFKISGLYPEHKDGILVFTHYGKCIIPLEDIDFIINSLEVIRNTSKLI